MGRASWNCSFVLSLIFVGVEIRHNTNATEAQALLELNVASNEIMMAQAENGELARIMELGLKQPESLSEIEAYQFRSWVYSMLNVHENAYIFFSLGMLNEESYDAWAAGTCILLSDRGIQSMWKDNYLNFQPDFETYIVDRCGIAR